MAASPPTPARQVRKRDGYTRQRAKRTRPKTPAPTNGWLLAELSTLTGVSVRALRYYVAHDLLRPLEFRGTATRYPRGQLLRLLKMLQLKSESRSRLVIAKLKAQLDALSDPELEAWAAGQKWSRDLARALGVAAQVAPAVTPSGIETGVESGALERAGVSTWQRIPLLPGLELMLSTDAGPAVLSIAQRLYAEVVGLSKR